MLSLILPTFNEALNITLLVVLAVEVCDRLRVADSADRGLSVAQPLLEQPGHLVE